VTPEQVVARLRAAGCVWAEDEAALLVAEAGSPAELREMVARRESGEPLELVVGWVEFLGRRLAVAPGVFVPRRRTELLAREAMARTASGSVALEMCCGVAPVAALLDGFGAEVHAADVSDVAVACARANAPHARVHRGDLSAALPAGLAGRVDVLAANAPYVPTDRIAVMPPEARDHEPAVALDGGPDGVALHRRLAAEGAPWLAAGGVMLIETSPDQALLTSQAMSTAGLATGVVVDEEVGGCVVVGVRTGAAGRG
jgi:release factor glutamine methyltransferase